MDKMDLFLQLRKEKLVSVVRTDSASEKIDAIVEGGINFIEITMTMPDALNILIEKTDKYRDSNVIIGAGTVLDAVSARLALLNGAEFIVSPAFDVETAKICNLYRKIYIPGIQSANDIRKCLEYGVDVLKLFPGNQYSKKIIKDLKGPFPQAHFMVTGQINLQTMPEWLDNGAFAVGVGGELTNFTKKETVKIQEKAKQFVMCVK